MKRWYVVHTHVRGEDKALFHLTRQGFTVYLPRYLKKRRHARKTDWVPAPLFPRYLFVEMDTERDRWRAIQSSVGVADIIRHGDSPAPAPFGIVERIQARESNDGFVVLGGGQGFTKGMRVRVLDGALAEYEGIFDCADDNRRAFILIDLMGRSVRARLPLDAVAAIG